MSRAWPAPDAIERMEATFDWLKWLDPVDRKIVWMRASGERRKNICWKTEPSRPAPWQQWAAALCVIEYCFAMSSSSPLLKAEAKDKLCRTDDMPITRNVGENHSVPHSSAVGINRQTQQRRSQGLACRRAGQNCRSTHQQD
jgi:hypothetical protein